MKRIGLLIALLTILSLFLFGCATIQKPSKSEPEVSAKQTSAKETKTKDENGVSNTQTTTNQQETKTTSKGNGDSKDKEFVVTEKVYKETFNAIEETIFKLNKIIRNRDYDTWTTYLTEEYVKRVSDPAFLSRLSESPILKRNNIKLRTLKDYFLYVVVPSRTDARLDKIEIIDKNHVKAITMIDNNPTILYWLENVNNQWKIGVMKE